MKLKTASTVRIGRLEDSHRKLAQKCVTSALPSFDDLPDCALVRQRDLVRDSRHPTRPTPLPFSHATFWRKVKEGQFPKPIKLGKHITAWKVGEVRAWMEAQAHVADDEMLAVDAARMQVTQDMIDAEATCLANKVQLKVRQS
jgi:prophage regulatory protein